MISGADSPRPAQIDFERARIWTEAIRSEVLRQVEEHRLPEDLSNALIQQLQRANRTFGNGSPNAVTLLPVAAYEAAGGNRIEAATIVGAAFEFLQAAGDMLDDWMDGDSQIEEAAEGGVHTIVVFTTLLLLANHALGTHRSQSAFGTERVRQAQRALMKLQLAALAGQHQEQASSGSNSVDVSAALSVTVKKSGSLGRCAATLGATLATDDARLIELLGEFGQHIATVHQLMNDIQGVWPEGRPSRDISNRTMTLPLSFALSTTCNGNESLARLKEALASKVASEPEMRRLLAGSGAIHYAWIMAATHRIAATRANRAIQAIRAESDLSWLASP